MVVHLERLLVVILVIVCTGLGLVFGQTGVTKQANITGGWTINNHKNPEVGGSYLYGVYVGETHHFSKNIGFQCGLVYSWENNHYTVNQLSTRERKDFAYSKLQFHKVAAPLNLSVYFKENLWLNTGFTFGYAFHDVTKVYNVNYLFTEVYDKSHRTLLTTKKGQYNDQMINLWQLGINWKIKLTKSHLTWGLEYGRYVKPFRFEYHGTAYTYSVSRVNFKTGFWWD